MENQEIISAYREIEKDLSSYKIEALRKQRILEKEFLEKNLKFQEGEVVSVMWYDRHCTPKEGWYDAVFIRAEVTHNFAISCICKNIKQDGTVGKQVLSVFGCNFVYKPDDTEFRETIKKKDTIKILPIK